MNPFSPVSSIMTTHLLTVNPHDDLADVKSAFAQKNIHHLPVVHVGKLIGMISKHDFERFAGSLHQRPEDAALNESRLHRFKAEDIMTKKLGKLEAGDRINVAIDIFLQNRFHALPVVAEDGELVGIVTPFDILKAIADEKPEHPEDVYEKPHFSAYS